MDRLISVAGDGVCGIALVCRSGDEGLGAGVGSVVKGISSFGTGGSGSALSVEDGDIWAIGRGFVIMGVV